MPFSYNYFIKKTVKVKAFIGGRIPGIFVKKSALRRRNNINSRDWKSRAIGAEDSASTRNLVPLFEYFLGFSALIGYLRRNEQACGCLRRRCARIKNRLQELL
jgi:hypothetical protein